jgi:hypothetical protein
MINKVNQLRNKKIYITSAARMIIFLVLAVSLINSQGLFDNNFNSNTLANKIKSKSDNIKQTADDDGNEDYHVKPHQFTLTLTGGYLLPTGDLKGDVSQINFRNSASTALSYYENYGYTFGLLGKLSTDKKDRFRITVSFALNYFRNSGLDSSQIYTVQPEMNFLQFGLGAEYSFMKKGRIVPFIGFDINTTSYYGAVNIIDESTQSQVSLEYNPVKRYGASVIGGVDYHISDGFGISGGLKYSITNIIGKNYDASGSHDLDDDTYTLNGFTIDKKTISYLGIYVGLTLFMGD